MPHVAAGSAPRLLQVSIALALVVLCLVGAFALQPTVAQSGGFESATIYGFVVDSSSGTSLPAAGLTVTASREHFLGANTTTDATGAYQLELPKGSFMVRVLSPAGDTLGRANITLELDDVQRWDFTIDSHDVEKSGLRGSVFDDTRLRYREGLAVRLTQCSDISCAQLLPYEKRATTDVRGSFALPNLKAGTYQLRIQDQLTDEVVVDEVIRLGFEEQRTLRLHITSEGEVFTPDYLWHLLQTKTVFWGLLAVILVLGGLLLAAVSRLAERLIRLSHHLIDERIADFVQDTAQWFVVLLATGAVVWDLAQISFTLENFVWLPFSTLFSSLMWILLMAVLMRLLLLLLGRASVFWHHRVSARTAAGLTALTPRMVTFSTLLLKNLVLVVGGIAILLTALAALGKTDLILGGVLSGLQQNLNFIIFMVVLLIVATLALRVIDIWFEDIGAGSSRLTPEMLKVAKGAARIGLVGLIVILALFTVLSAAGLGEIAQLLIIVLSMMVGLVVSFAATGSIGNLLAGLVLQSTRPFEVGDWICVHDNHIRVTEVSLMYTKGVTFRGERLTLPNNIVLNDGHTNYSLSVRRDGSYAVEIEATIGYDVPPGTVEELMVTAAERTEGVLHDPPPQVMTTKFLDHAVGYLLRAFINEPQFHPQVRTDLMFNMLDTFHAAGVEILSPLWEIQRSDQGAVREAIRARSDQPRTKRTSLRYDQTRRQGDDHGHQHRHPSTQAPLPPTAEGLAPDSVSIEAGTSLGSATAQEPGPAAPSTPPLVALQPPVGAASSPTPAVASQEIVAMPTPPPPLPTPVEWPTGPAPPPR